MLVRSEFFKSATKEEWRKGKDAIKVPEDDAEVFNVYVQWLYSGRIPLAIDTAQMDYTFLAKLYVLGEKLIDITFKDAVINKIVANTRALAKNGQRYYPSPSVVDIIYEHTMSGSPARHLMVDLYVRTAVDGWELDANHEFMVDLAKSLVKNRVLLHKDDKLYKELDAGVACAYHSHDKDKPCEGGKA